MTKSYKTPETTLFSTLWGIQNGLCARCSAPMLKNRFEAPHARIWAKHRATVDHIVPVSKGGTDAAENLQLMHARCNKIKGNQV